MRTATVKSKSKRPQLPAIIAAVLMNFESGCTLVVDHDSKKAKFQGMSPQQHIEFKDGAEMQKKLQTGVVKSWFDARFPGQLVVIEGGEHHVNGIVPQARRSDRPAIPGAANEIEPTASFETVTPETALKWLELNVSNRPMDSKTVGRYAGLMKKGKFMVTGDAIQFDIDGQLVNGQHRLKAITLSQVPHKMLVVRGLAPEVFQVLDYGKRRSPADALAIEGFQNSRNLAALCKLIFAWMAGILERSTKVSVEPQYVVDIAYAFDGEDQPETVTGAIQFTHGQYPKFKQLLPLSYVSFVYWAYARLGEDEKQKMQTFVKQLATGIGINDEKSPVGQLRSTMIENALSDKKLPAFIRLGYTIQAASLHVAGKKAGTLRWTGDYPEPGIAPILAETLVLDRQ